MDVTPPPKMFEAMSKFTDAIVGEAPSPLDHSTGAMRRREKRQHVMDFLHGMVAFSMREGAVRAAHPNRTELGAYEQQMKAAVEHD